MAIKEKNAMDSQENENLLQKKKIASDFFFSLPPQNSIEKKEEKSVQKKNDPVLSKKNRLIPPKENFLYYPNTFFQKGVLKMKENKNSKNKNPFLIEEYQVKRIDLIDNDKYSLALYGPQMGINFASYFFGIIKEISRFKEDPFGPKNLKIINILRSAGLGDNGYHYKNIEKACTFFGHFRFDILKKNLKGKIDSYKFIPIIFYNEYCIEDGWIKCSLNPDFCLFLNSGYVEIDFRIWNKIQTDMGKFLYGYIESFENIHFLNPIHIQSLITEPSNSKWGKYEFQRKLKETLIQLKDLNIIQEFEKKQNNLLILKVQKIPHEGPKIPHEGPKPNHRTMAESSIHIEGQA